MKPTRDDLRKTIFPGSRVYPVTDADLAAMGYYRLDGIDVEALRQALNEMSMYGGDMMLSPIFEAAEQVLAALDGETT